MRRLRRVIRFVDFHLPIAVVVCTVIGILWILFAFPPVPWSWQK